MFANNVLIVEGNNNTGWVGKSEQLEEELERCVYSWRKYFPDIPVVAVCPTSNEPNKNLIKKLDIEYYCLGLEKDTRTGYYNIPIGLAWAEENIKCDIMIHIDLDMETLRRFKIPDITDEVYIGRLNDKESKSWHIEDVPYNFESNFIITKRNLGFFKIWETTSRDWQRKLKDFDNEKYAEGEEFAIDTLYRDKVFNIKPMIDYQIGNRYKFDNINNYKNIKFHHNHINESKMEYIRYKLWQFQTN